MKKVRYRYHEGQFNFKEDDYVTIVVHYLYVDDPEKELYYHGTLKQIDSVGFHAVLDDDKSKEQYFAFADIEKVVPGHYMPFLGGYTRRKKDM
jgi:hypothetical protein